MIDSRILIVNNGLKIPFTKSQYEAYRELGFSQPDWGSWDEEIIKLFPYLKDEKSFNEHYGNQ